LIGIMINDWSPDICYITSQKQSNSIRLISLIYLLEFTPVTVMKMTSQLNYLKMS